MYSILVAIAGFGLIMYFFLPFVLGSLIFFEHKGLFFDKPLKQRKILSSITYVSYTFYALRILLKLRTSKFFTQW